MDINTHLFPTKAQIPSVPPELQANLVVYVEHLALLIHFYPSEIQPEIKLLQLEVLVSTRSVHTYNLH